MRTVRNRAKPILAKQSEGHRIVLESRRHSPASQPGDFVRAIFVALTLVIPSSPALADAPRLSMPIACEPGRDCHLQQYPDWDPGPGAKDYRCGPQSYDTHTGTDIRLSDIRALDRNVAVLAAAPGVVKATREGMPDAFLDEVRPDLLEKQGCGNAVVLAHEGGLETWYCHLKRGSVAVRKGQPVRRGERIAAVGLSGKTEFVHLEFVVRREGKTIDPFTGTVPEGACGTERGTGLWTDSAAQALTYRPAEIVNAGFTDGKVSTRSVEIAVHDRAIPAGRPLFLYARIAHAEPGDTLVLSVKGAAGPLLHRRATIDVNRPKAQWAAAVKVPEPPGGWPSGIFRAEIRLLRDGQEISSRRFESRPFID